MFRALSVVTHWKTTLNGLEQAARGYYDALNNTLVRALLITIWTDPAVFYHCLNNQKNWVVAYVDDFFFISKKCANIKKLN